MHCRMLRSGQASRDTFWGTFDYCAPETLLGEPITDKADVYSLGVILWEMMTGGPRPPPRLPQPYAQQ
jgi:serine/threonine protein kinase